MESSIIKSRLFQPERKGTVFIFSLALIQVIADAIQENIGRTEGHSRTEGQKLSTGSHRSGQKVVILSNRMWTSLAMCPGLHSATGWLCFHHHHRQAPLPHAALPVMQEEHRGGHLEHPGLTTQKTSARQLIQGNHSISSSLTCAIFSDFSPKHILALHRGKKDHSFTQVWLLTRVHVDVINTVRKSALVSVCWHLKCTANKYSTWKLWVVKKQFQCYSVLPQKRVRGSYVFILYFKIEISFS